MISFKQRLAVFLLLWLLAGAIGGLFADVSFEAGESAFWGRFELVYLAPLISVICVAGTLFQNHFNSWQQRDHYRWIVVFVLLAAYLIHAIAVLTRTNRRQFVALTAIQIVFLAISTACVLYYFHYDSLHGHG